MPITIVKRIAVLLVAGAGLVAGWASADEATVYNTLNLFLEKKLIREVIVDPSKVFYDPNTQPHHHIYNVDTGELADIDAAPIEVHGLPALPEGVVTEGVDIIVRVSSRRA